MSLKEDLPVEKADYIMKNQVEITPVLTSF